MGVKQVLHVGKGTVPAAMQISDALCFASALDSNIVAILLPGNLLKISFYHTVFYCVYMVDFYSKAVLLHDCAV